MGFLDNILAKLGLGSRDTAPAPAPQSEVVIEIPAPTPIAPAVPAPIAVVDVVAQLEKLAAATPQKLNWRVSIADLLRLLNLDPSLAARKEMARELGCPEELIGGDYSRMNIWLHKTVLARIAANGGNIPRELLD
ncbi:MAG: DUF3597 domain-containing protein [Thermoanaerobaculaceae bacterium]|jgi:hypothetical protein|nr:DUF3597 domain-containing protein [Thermoanaerobaculaceae bacterium]